MEKGVFDVNAITELCAYGSGAVLVGLSSMIILECVFIGVSKVVSLFRSAL